jgi:hypothetical protein
VLADDMGLGKTVQTLAHLAIEQAEGRLDSPALIVCPTRSGGPACGRRREGTEPAGPAAIQAAASAWARRSFFFPNNPQAQPSV